VLKHKAASNPHDSFQVFGIGVTSRAGGGCDRPRPI